MNRSLLIFIFFASLFILSSCSPAETTHMPAGTPDGTTVPAAPTAPVSPLPSETVDTQWIALIGLDKNLWLVDAVTGAEKQITEDATPSSQITSSEYRTYYCCASWSSDGQLLAYRGLQIDAATQTKFLFSIWVYDLARGEAQVLYQDKPVSRLAFRPGTHLLAFDEVLDPAYFVNGRPDPAQARGIFGLDVETGEVSQLVAPEKGLWLSAPRWSIDGSILSFVEQVRYEDPTPFAVYDFGEKAYHSWDLVIGGYALAPDGQRVAYDRMGTLAGEERIWIRDIYGKNEQQLSPEDGSVAYDPAWSPVGDLLAYKLGDPASSDVRLVVQPAAGGEVRSLGSFVAMGPLAWSPDGARLAFSTGSDEQPQLVVVTVADGSIKDLGSGFVPTWQP